MTSPFPKMHDIKNNAWVTVNNDFFVTSEAIRQWISRVTKSRVKIIAESPHEWQKIVIPWITIFLSRVRRFGNDFHKWRSHCRIASRVTKKSLFTVTNVLFYFLHAILYHEHTNLLRTIIEPSFRHCCQGRPFLNEHCDVTIIDLWRHANAKYWYCDVIFVYCHCTRKLAQKRS